LEYKLRDSTPPIFFILVVVKISSSFNDRKYKLFVAFWKD
jgi:hypothetical protein